MTCAKEENGYYVVGLTLVKQRAILSRLGVETALDHFSQEDLDQVALELNERPRKTIGYKIPTEVISNAVALPP